MSAPEKPQSEKKETAAPAATPAAPAQGAVQADPLKTHEAKKLKHTSPVISCRYDPTGKYVFFGAQDFRVWRWEISTDKKAELTGHRSWVRALAFDPKGAALVTGGYEGDLIWWNATAEKPTPQRTIVGHKGWVRAVAISPDGSLLASVGNDNLVKLWNMADGKLVREMAGHDSHVYNTVFHPDGKQLASGDLKGNLIHWEVETGKEVRKVTLKDLHKYDTGFRADIGGFRGMGFSPDGKLLACGGMTKVTNAFAGVGLPLVVLVDWEAGKEKIQHLTKGITQACIWNTAIHRQKFTIAASGGNNGKHLHFWKHDQKEPFHQLVLANTARDMDLSPDELHIVTAHFDSHVRIYKMAAKA